MWWITQLVSQELICWIVIYLVQQPRPGLHPFRTECILKFFLNSRFISLLTPCCKSSQTFFWLSASMTVKTSLLILAKFLKTWQRCSSGILAFKSKGSKEQYEIMWNPHIKKGSVYKMVKLSILWLLFLKTISLPFRRTLVSKQMKSMVQLYLALKRLCSQLKITRSIVIDF